MGGLQALERDFDVFTEEKSGEKEKESLMLVASKTPKEKIAKLIKIS